MRGGVATAAVALLALTGGVAGGLVAGNHSTVIERGSSVAATHVSATFSGDTLDVAEVVEKLKPSVVTISSTTVTQSNSYGYGFGQGNPYGGSATSRSAGTGVIVSADGEVLTNAHVVSGAQSIEVTLSDGTTHSATLVGADTSQDVALIKIEGVSGLTPADLATGDNLQVGDDVVAIGNALDLKGAPTVTRGIVSALGRAISTEDSTLTGLIQTDAAISSGNSGGPLVNAQGQVVGIDTAVATSSQGVSASNIGFAIPIEHAMEVAKQLRARA